MKPKTFTLNIKLNERERTRKKRLGRYVTWRNVITNGLNTLEQDVRK